MGRSRYEFLASVAFSFYYTIRVASINARRLTFGSLAAHKSSASSQEKLEDSTINYLPCAVDTCVRDLLEVFGHPIFHGVPRTFEHCNEKHIDGPFRNAGRALMKAAAHFWRNGSVGAKYM